MNFGLFIITFLTVFLSILKMHGSLPKPLAAAFFALAAGVIVILFPWYINLILALAICTGVILAAK